MAPDAPDMPPTSSTSASSPICAANASAAWAVSDSGVPSGVETVMLISVLCMEGMNWVPLEISRTPLTINKASAPAITTSFPFNAIRSSLSYPFWIPTNRRVSFCCVLRRSPADIMGTRLSATTRLASRE